VAQVSLSFDVDWAADELLEDTLQLLLDAGAKATFFATHVTELLARLDPHQFEIGIHPDFNPLLNGKPKEGKATFRDVLSDAMSWYPDVVGFRSHGVVSSGPIMYHAPEYGLQYESNMYFPWPVPCFRDYDKLIRIPMYWSDYRELLVGTPYDAARIELPKDIPAVFAFHPIHIFLNSETPERPRRTRGMSPDALKRERHVGAPAGARDFLIGLLERIKREGHETVTMREIAEAHAKKHGDAIGIHLHKA
jgi:hypothetical protein